MSTGRRVRQHSTGHRDILERQSTAEQSPRPAARDNWLHDGAWVLLAAPAPLRLRQVGESFGELRTLIGEGEDARVEVFDALKLPGRQRRELRL